jgi:ABC-type nickel/cobalt efflux system permease component RcnA
LITSITGFIASVAHVVTGPDHLAAVTPLSIDSRKRSWTIGLFWGLGHTLGMILIGAVFLIFREVFPVERISLHSELIIGILLIVIGSWAIFRVYRRHFHASGSHAHFHTHPHLYAHNHEHTHGHPGHHEHLHPGEVNSRHKQNLITSLSIGVLHGFAGFSHLLALLPSLALPSHSDAIVYLVSFAFGTIITMMIFSFMIGRIADRAVRNKNLNFLRWYTLAGGWLAIAIGIYWLILSL